MWVTHFGMISCINNNKKIIKMTETQVDFIVKEIELAVVKMDLLKAENELLKKANKELTEQLIIPVVSCSLPSKEAMNIQVNKLIFENFEEDEIANRREYAFGFRACYRWIVKDLKHK